MPRQPGVLQLHPVVILDHAITQNVAPRRPVGQAVWRRFSGRIPVDPRKQITPDHAATLPRDVVPAR
jgi:hypothetical protein